MSFPMKQIPLWIMNGDCVTHTNPDYFCVRLRKTAHSKDRACAYFEPIPEVIIRKQNHRRCKNCVYFRRQKYATE